MEDNSKTNGAGHNSALFSEAVADHAVKFVDRLSNLARRAKQQISRGIVGKNAVVRAVAVRDADATMHKIIKETYDWHAVIETMKQGKDVHLEENCKGSKLEIVAGAEYEFGQYIIDQSDGKFCEQNPDLSSGYPRGNISGKEYMEKVNAK